MKQDMLEMLNSQLLPELDMMQFMPDIEADAEQEVAMMFSHHAPLDTESPSQLSTYMEQATTRFHS